MSDYRIEAATKDEWAARALAAEARLAKATDTLARIVRGDDDAHNWAIWTLAELKGLTGGRDENQKSDR